MGAGYARIVGAQHGVSKGSSASPMANAGSNPGTYARWMSKSVALMTALTLSVLGDMQVAARLGDTVELCLKESPTTGFLWGVAGSLPSGIEQLSTSY